MSIKVKATQLGYYGNRRVKPDEVFDIVQEQDFSKNWMVKVGVVEPKPEPKAETVSEPEPSNAEKAALKSVVKPKKKAAKRGRPKKVKVEI